MSNEKELLYPIQIGTGHYRAAGFSRSDAEYYSRRSLQQSIRRVVGKNEQTMEEILEGIRTERANRLAVADQTWVKDLKGNNKHE